MTTELWNWPDSGSTPEEREAWSRRVILVEFPRTGDGFVVGGVAMHGGAIRYREDTPDFTKAAASFRSDVEYLSRWYGVEGSERSGPPEIDSWGRMFLRMDGSSNNGYTFLRYAVVLDFAPTEADLDAIFDYYVIRRQKEKFAPPGA